MDATEICPLTEEAIGRLLAGRSIELCQPGTNGRRVAPRWPFPGTVEMWLPDDEGVEQHHLATCINLSLHGLGMLCDDELPIGLEFALAIHQPESSFHGRAVVRHCTEVQAGYYVGIQFIFD